MISKNEIKPDVSEIQFERVMQLVHELDDR